MPLTSDDIAVHLQTRSGWQLQGEALAKTFAFPSFADAIAFVTRLAFDAEASDHHPDLQISYRKVRVSWSTHSEGGVTEKDIAGIDQTERAATPFLSSTYPPHGDAPAQ